MIFFNEISYFHHIFSIIYQSIVEIHNILLFINVLLTFTTFIDILNRMIIFISSKFLNILFFIYNIHSITIKKFIKTNLNLFNVLN